MNYLDYTGVVISWIEGSDEALVHLSYPNEDSEEDTLYPVLRYEGIQKVCEDFDPDEIEGLSVDLVSQYIVAHVDIGQGQGTILLVWDIENDKLIHISSCPHGVKSVVSEEYIYTICDICLYGSPRHFAVAKTKLGVLNRWEEADYLDFGLELERGEKIEYDDIFIRVDEDELVVGYKKISGKCNK